ncbi:energy transducer TonB [Flavobacteriaceae bacterium GSB9]|nr:energy transducer TonB [Flavobacteriaceae bacterium GSB9]
MHLTNQHRALLITFLISGTVVLSIFNIGLKKHSEFISESYYVIEPEKDPTEEELKQLEALENANKAKAETNKAFNEAQENKRFAQAFKRIAPPEDYIPKSSDFSENSLTAKRDYTLPDNSKLNQDALSQFNKANEVLKKQLAENNNHKSTISYSLANRKKIYIPIPVYLCEVDGKIVVNVKVNNQGNVTDAYLNTSSNSNNECLIEHAIEYAKQSKFNADASKSSQLGSITFNFIGKR